MKLHYKNKKTEQEIFDSISNVELYPREISNSKNLLIHCNNLIALKHLITNHSLKGKVDLVYIDPPFATNNTFTIS